MNGFVNEKQGWYQGKKPEKPPRDGIVLLEMLVDQMDLLSRLWRLRTDPVSTIVAKRFIYRKLLPGDLEHTELVLAKKRSCGSADNSYSWNLRYDFDCATSTDEAVINLKGKQLTFAKYRIGLQVEVAPRGPI